MAVRRSLVVAAREGKRTGMEDQSNVLAGLDAIDWSGEVHAYGKAPGTPQHLYALLSPDEQQRRAAGTHLAQTLNHQGTLIPAALTAAPFIVQIACTAALPARLDALSLLHNLVESHYWHAHEAPYLGELLHTFSLPDSPDGLLLLLDIESA